MGQYLIPANSKRSMMILGLFTPVDLIIFGVGATITAALMMFVHAETLNDVLVIVSPLLITSAMVVPVPNHRNVWQLTANVYHFFANRRTYYWKGWCMTYGEKDEQK